MEIGRRNYTAEEIEAALQVLTELTHLFGEARDGIVLVGGWVPYFAIPQDHEPHEGTKDVDLALDPRSMPKNVYRTLGEKLLLALYQQDVRKPFRYYRTVSINSISIKVAVDFLTEEESNSMELDTIQEIQEIKASAIHGCEVAFLNPDEFTFIGEHPGGGQEEVTVRVASLPSFLAMKGLALRSRIGEDASKDAYDIYYCIKNYPGGLDSLAERFRPWVSNTVIQEGLNCLADLFASLDHVGPRFVADRSINKEIKELLRRDAYEQINGLLERIYFP